MQLRQSGIRWTSGALLILGGYVIGGTVGRPAPAGAEVRETTPPDAFKSGGARSEVVLKEIAVMLRQMDARLANLEKAANELVLLNKGGEAEVGGQAAAIRGRRAAAGSQ